MAKDKAKRGVSETEAGAAVKTLAIPNKCLGLLYKMLDVPLHGSQARARARFAKLIKQAAFDVQEFLADKDSKRVELAEKFAEKDPKTGKAIELDGGTRYHITDENMVKFEKAVKPHKAETEAYLDEELIVDLLPSVKADFLAIRPVVLESKLTLGTIDSYIFEVLCERFQNV